VLSDISVDVVSVFKSKSNDPAACSLACTLLAVAGIEYYVLTVARLLSLIANARRSDMKVKT